MKNEPVFLTDKNHNIVLEALIPANPLKSWTRQPLRAQRKNIFR